MKWPGCFGYAWRHVVLRDSFFTVVPASRHFRSTYSIVDFWIMYKNLQIHAMRATFHIVFSVRI